MKQVPAPLLDLVSLPWRKGQSYEWLWINPDEHLKKRSDGSAYTESAYPSYTGLIESAGLEILVQVDQDDYQGDTLMIVKYGSKYGVCNYGWGSCSGCDALEGCCNEKELLELRESIVNGIQWFGSKKSALQFVQERDWKVQPIYISDEKLVEQFIAECAEVLG